MAWAAGVPHANIVNTTSSGGGVNVYYDKRFLRHTANELVVAPLGQKRDLPKNEGDTTQFFRYNEISPALSSRRLTQGTNPDATLVTGQDISAKIEEWGGFSQHSCLLEETFIDPKLKGLAGLWGSDAGNTIDLITQCAIVTGGAYPMRADGYDTGDGNYSFQGTLTTVTSSTVIADTDLANNADFGNANDDLNQSVIVILTGTGRNQARPIVDYATSGGVMTVSPAFDVTPAVGDTYHVVSAHGLTSSHKLTTTNIRAAVTRQRNNKATTFSGGYYVGVLSPDTEAGLMADSTWTNVMTYRDSPAIRAEGLYRNEVGMWGGVRWVRTTLPFRFPITDPGTAGASYGVGAFVPGSTYTNYSNSGAIYANLILGQEAFGCTTLKGNNYMSPGIIVKKSGPQDTSNPLNMFSTVGWYLPFIAKGLNPKFAVQMWSGA